MHKTSSSTSFSGVAHVFSSQLRHMLPLINFIRGGDNPNACLHNVTQLHTPSNVTTRLSIGCPRKIAIFYNVGGTCASHISISQLVYRSSRDQAWYALEN
jgi:hypothetical protein